MKKIFDIIVVLDKEAIQEVDAKFTISDTVVYVSDRPLEKKTTIDVNDCLTRAEFLVSQHRLKSQLDGEIDRLIDECGSLEIPFRAAAIQIFEHNLHELHKWIFTIRELLRSQNDCHPRLFIPAPTGCSEIVLYDAEGETSSTGFRTLAYNRRDFLPGLIAQAIQNATRTEVFLYSKRSIKDEVILSCRKWLRVYGVLLARGAIAVRNYAKLVMIGARDPFANPGIDAEVLLVSRSTVHSEFFAGLLGRREFEVLVQENVFSEGRNCDYLRTLNPQIAVNNVLQYLRWKDFAASAIQCVKSISRSKRATPTVVQLSEIGLAMDLSFAIKEHLAHSFESRILARALDRRLAAAGSRVSKVLHCEIFSPHAPYIEQAARRRGVATHQFAFGTYEMRPCVRFVFADRFFCFSKRQYDSMLSVGVPEDEIEYIGNPLVLDSGEHFGCGGTGGSVERKLLFFCQPIRDNEERVLLDNIARFAREFQMSLAVVLHPRDSEAKRKAYSEFCTVLDNVTYLKNRDAIDRSASFAVTRTSNVAYRLILAGVPVMNVLMSAADRLVVQEYYAGYPFVFDSVWKTESVLLDIATARKKFFEFRSSFIERNFCGKTLSDVFVALLSKPR